MNTKLLAVLFLGMMLIKQFDVKEQTYYSIWQTYCVTEEQRLNSSTECKCSATPLTLEEFKFFARVVEAESDRSASRDGKRLIACVIINRTFNSTSFPDTVTGVLTQSGQFAVVQSGRCNVQSTKESELAIVEAFEMVANEEVPANLLFFNSIGYNGTPYALVDGNYFILGG